ncbi:DegT/DnrJ/EryC1/StrS aminotransferase [Actinobacteria bacterium OV320]|nr:DegT/DnrJ/EryC1/StrS aminotransferase [Actinobacteria bacterium OV320]
MTGFGLRYQMSGISAAIGLAQLAQFERTEAAHRALWHTYRHALAPLDRVTLIDVGPDRCVPHLCQVRVPGRDTVFAQLKARGIGVGVHYPPNHLQPAFARWRRNLPATEHVAGEILTLPFHRYLTETDIGHVVTALDEVLTSVGAASCAAS